MIYAGISPICFLIKINWYEIINKIIFIDKKVTLHCGSWRWATLIHGYYVKHINININRYMLISVTATLQAQKL